MYVGSRALDFLVDAQCPKDSRIVFSRRIPRWVFITAYNPTSVMLSERENLVLDKKLKNFLIGKKFKFVRGDAIPTSSDWTIEKGFFVFNISKAVGKKYVRGSIKMRSFILERLIDLILFGMRQFWVDHK